LSEALFKLEADYLKRLQLFILSNPNNSCLKTLKNYLLNKSPDELTIREYWQKVIDDLISKKRLGGAKVHKQSMATIGRYTNLNIPFKDFSYRNLLELEKNMHITGISINGMGVYLRSLRTIFNMAINEDLISVEWYPFRKYKIRKEKTSPRVLSKAELKTYFNWNIPASHPEYNFWNIGKLLFMLRGINITDLLLLSETNLKNDRIIYRRSKTGKLYSIKLNNEIREVLNQFTSTSTLLGLVELKDMNNSRRIENLVQRRKVINHHLTKIGKSLGFREKLTTYVFRYSYANLAKQMGYSKDIIAEALGHEYGNSVTGIYLEQFDQEIVDKMNQALMETLLD
jgi:integrase